MTNGNFNRLVAQRIILNPDAFTEADRAKVDALTPAEVDALISIRAKLGDQFIQKYAPSLAIVF